MNKLLLTLGSAALASSMTMAYANDPASAPGAADYDATGASGMGTTDTGTTDYDAGTGTGERDSVSGSTGASGTDAMDSTGTMDSAGAPAGSGSSTGLMGEHSMAATVQSIDKEKGIVNVRAEGEDLKIHFPPESVSTLNEGDTITVHMGFQNSSM